MSSPDLAVAAPACPLCPALTAREHEVLALVAAGCSNEGIGARLWLSKKTVESHIHSIYGKLDLPEDPEVNRRVRAVTTWLAHHAWTDPVS